MIDKDEDCFLIEIINSKGKPTEALSKTLKSAIRHVNKMFVGSFEFHRLAFSTVHRHISENGEYIQKMSECKVKIKKVHIKDFV